MTEKMNISSETLNRLLEFSKEREWGQFHSPENLAKSISIEAAELLELFQWDSSFQKSELEGEIADILSYCLLLANKVGIDPDAAIVRKIEINEKRYPVRKSKGNSTKYHSL